MGINLVVTQRPIDKIGENVRLDLIHDEVWNDWSNHVVHDDSNYWTYLQEDISALLESLKSGSSGTSLPTVSLPSHVFIQKVWGDPRLHFFLLEDSGYVSPFLLWDAVSGKYRIARMRHG